MGGDQRVAGLERLGKLLGDAHLEELGPFVIGVIGTQS